MVADPIITCRAQLGWVSPQSPPAAFYDAWRLIDLSAVQVRTDYLTYNCQKRTSMMLAGEISSPCRAVLFLQWSVAPLLVPTWVALVMVVAFSSSLDVAAIETEVGRKQ